MVTLTAGAVTSCCGTTKYVADPNNSGLLICPDCNERHHVNETTAVQLKAKGSKQSGSSR